MGSLRHWRMARRRFRNKIRRMRTLLNFSAPLATLLLAATQLSAQPKQPASSSASEYGPSNGALIIAGGGGLAGTGISERFIALAGGPEARIVVVPTAGGNRKPDGSVTVYEEAQVLASWRALGLTNVRMLHTHDAKLADTDAFAEQLRGATGVWFNGGRQWNIVDSYAGTKTYRAFHDVLARGGVIGGSSAGATIQGAYLVRGAISGPDVMMSPEPEHQDAFGFLKRSAIDQHINTRNRWDDLIPVIKRFPDLLGIGLSEGTAIEVHGDTFTVMGKAQVTVHDNTRSYRPDAKPYLLLKAGDAFDMKKRVATLGTP